MNRIAELDDELQTKRRGGEDPQQDDQQQDDREEVDASERDGDGADSRREPTATSLSTYQKYTVPGTVPAVRQPKAMACWATVATMLMSWHDRRSYEIKDALASLGQEWNEILAANTGLSTSKAATFFATVGLQQEPAMNYSADGWERLLRRFGPLWVTTQEGGSPFSLHARVMTGIEGDGRVDATFVHIVDPADGTEKTERLRDFVRKFESPVYDKRVPLDFVVVHYPADASRATTQSYMAPASEYAQQQEVAGAVVAGVGLTWQILQDVLTPTTDITWTYQWMEGAKHPSDDKRYDKKGVWQEKTVKVSSGIETPAAGTQSAEFDVTFRYNGWSVGYVTTQKVGAEDALFWKLDIMQKVMVLPDRAVKGKKPIATVEVSFNYRHYSAIHADRIYLEKLTLYGTGDVDVDRKWTQSGGY
jgi:hypothetical protein